MTERRGERSQRPLYGQPLSGRHRAVNSSSLGYRRDAKGKLDPGDESGVGGGDNGRRDCLGDPRG